jgi:spermidine synthase
MWIASSLPIAAAFVATLALGALLPLVLREQAAEDGVAARTAGRSFFVFALGALAAAVLLPYSFLLPSALRVVPIVAAAPLLLVVLALWPRGGGIMTAAAAAAALVAGPLAFLNRPLLEGARNWPLHQVRKSVLAARADRVTSASVVADRLAGERLLYTDEFAAAGGVSSSYMRALGLLPVWFTEGRSEACALICLGTGTTAAALARSGARMHVVELSQAVVDLSIDWFGDNARAWRPATGARLHVTDGRQWLERQPPASLRAVTLEPLLPQAPGSVHLYSRGFYQAATRALVSGGVCVQWLPTHGLGPAAYRSLLRTFLDEFDQARAFLVDDSTLLVGAKGTSLGPPRIGGSEDGYLCGIWSSLDLELAELDVAAARARVKDAAIVTDDRPFLETAIHASGREVLGWLPTNLEVWRTAASDVLARARAHRLSAKIDASTAQQLKDPLALARALDALALARRAFPASLLLWREAHRIKAQRVRQQAMASLVAGAWPQALEGFEESVRLGRGTPLSLAGRVAALWRMGRRKAARTALRDLRRWWPQVLQVREITVHRELLAVLSSKGLAEVGAEAVAQIRIGADIGRAWSDGADWVRHSRLRWPYLSRWQLVQVLIGGLEINESRVSSLLAELDPATLDALRPWVDRAPAHRSLLERYVPKTVPRPGWWSK